MVHHNGLLILVPQEYIGKEKDVLGGQMTVLSLGV